jgi:hypothetical protein
VPTRLAPGRTSPLTEDIEKCSDTIYLIQNVQFAPIPTLNARTAVPLHQLPVEDRGRRLQHYPTVADEREAP